MILLYAVDTYQSLSTFVCEWKCYCSGERTWQRTYSTKPLCVCVCVCVCVCMIVNSTCRSDAFESNNPRSSFSTIAYCISRGTSQSMAPVLIA